MTNNSIVLELVNAGCDLRKLTPGTLEKICEVCATPAEEREEVKPKTLSLSEVLASLRLMQLSAMEAVDRNILAEKLLENNKEDAIWYYKKLYRIADPTSENERALALVSSFLEQMT